jgi:hypothetical protein
MEKCLHVKKLKKLTKWQENVKTALKRPKFKKRVSLKHMM